MKKIKIGTISNIEILKKQRCTFRKTTKVESGRKQVKRVKNKLNKEIREYYCA